MGIHKADIRRKDILRLRGHTLLNLTHHRPEHILMAILRKAILRKAIPRRAIRQLLILVPLLRLNTGTDPGMEDLTWEQRHSWGEQRLLRQLLMEQAIWGTEEQAIWGTEEGSWAMEVMEAMEATSAACLAMGTATMASTASSSTASSASTSTVSTASAASSRSGSNRLSVSALE